MNAAVESDAGQEILGTPRSAKQKIEESREDAEREANEEKKDDDDDDDDSDDEDNDEDEDSEDEEGVDREDTGEAERKVGRFKVEEGERRETSLPVRSSGQSWETKYVWQSFVSTTNFSSLKK